MCLAVEGCGWMDKHGNMDWFAALEDNEIENQNLSTRQKVWTIYIWLDKVHAGVAMIMFSNQVTVCGFVQTLMCHSWSNQTNLVLV